jgi:tripeptidyl-peptidase-1
VLNNYDGQTSYRSDLALFLSQHSLDAVPAAQTFTIDVLNGGADQQSPINVVQAKAGSNIESNLDAEILLSFGHPTPLIASNTGGEPSYQEDASEGPNGVNEVSISCIRHGVPLF